MYDFTTHTALNGKEALELLEKLDSAPDLILSDIMMPVMNGYDFYKHVCENPKWIKVINRQGTFHTPSWGYLRRKHAWKGIDILGVFALPPKSSR